MLPVVRYQTSVGDFSTDVEAAVHTPYRPLSKPLRVPRVKIILMDFSGNLKISFNWTTLSTLVAQIPNESNTLNETNNFVLTHVEWFNETNFLLFGVFDTERCGFILLCSVLQEQKERRCQHVWYQCVWKGSLNMQRSSAELAGSSNGIDQFITKLPYITATEDTTYQIAILRLVPGERNQVTWLTTHPIQVHDLLHISNKSIFFTGTVQPATRHLYRLDLLPNWTVWCLTCVELNSRLTSLLPVNDLNMMRIVPAEKVNLTGGLLRSAARNATFRTITRVELSTSGVCFTLQWDTGNEIFGASGVKEAPTRMVINQLTRIGHEASEYDDSRFEASARFDPDSGVSLWCQMDNKNVTMVWHSHLFLSDHIRQVHPDTTNVDHLQKSSTRSRIVRSTLTDGSRVTSPKSAKQHQTLSPIHNMKEKAKHVGASQSPLHMLYPTPPFGDRPLPNVVLRLINLTTDKVRMIDFSGNLMGNQPLASDGVEDGALVRFWFPPYLNERHLQVYPLLINV
ncbi:unnamed protein product [Dicrocoelium dendriticum]|nr:unnamed protein product [Dicrocoelium dendriticum]